MSSINDQIESLRQFSRKKIQAKEIAAILGFSEAALSSQRRRGTGVPAVMLKGCRPFYDRDQVVGWLQEQLPWSSREPRPGISLAPSPDYAP